MKNKDKTIALTLLALLLYAFFVWHGMTYEPTVPNAFSASFDRITGGALQSASPRANSRSGVGPAGYLKTLGLTVYTDSEFAGISGGRIFTNKPKMTLFAFTPMPDGDAIIWHDGQEGYICLDVLGFLTNQQTSMKQTYIDMCRIYDFQLYMAGSDTKRIAYAPKKSTIEAYTRQTGNKVTKSYGTMALYADAVSKL